MHNIYLLKPTEEVIINIDYESNDGQVIVADSEEEARTLCKISDEGNIWINPKLVECDKIGETSTLEKGIVLVSNTGA